MKQEISPSVPPSSPLPKQIFHCSHQPHLPLCKDPSLQYPVLFQWCVISSQPQLVLFFRFISDIFGGENRNTCTLLFLLTSQMSTTYQKHFFQKISFILLHILHFSLVNCAHAQERDKDTMWGMAFARSLDWSIPVNVFQILGF